MSAATAAAAAAHRAEALRGHAAMLLFSVLIAGSFSLGAMTANEIDPGAFTAARFLVAAAVLAALVLARGLRIRRAHAAAPWRYLVLGGLYAAYFVLMFEGLKTAPPVATAAVFTLTPILTGLFGWLLLRQAMTGRMVLALAIGGAGALWVIFRGDPAALAAFGFGRGEAIYFVGCVAHALLTPLLRRFGRGEPPVISTLFITLTGAALLVVWSWGAIGAVDWGALPAVVWVTLAYTAVFASAATFVLIQYAAQRLPAAKVMAYTYLVPSWVILWEIALGRGAPPLLVLGGVALTVAALAVLLKPEPGDR